MNTGNTCTRARWLGRVLCGAATVQLVLFLLLHVPEYLSYQDYERGTEKMPFQGRMLMMFVLRWAHNNRWMIELAGWVGRTTPWFLPKISPEFLAEALIDILSILIAGWVSLRIYRASSHRQWMQPWIYPLVLVLCGCTYILQTSQHIRFPYDLPSLAFFSLGMEIIYFNYNPLWLAVVFVIGTVNRETTLLLLPLYGLSYFVRDGQLDWKHWRQVRLWSVVLPLGLYWIAWHIWVHHYFRHSQLANASRCALNIATLLWPAAWPQLLSAGCFLPPVLLLFHRSIHDPQLRAWLWILPGWYGVMFFYGIWIEPRIFGELIPYIVVCVVLIAEQSIANRITNPLLKQPVRSSPADDPMACR